MLGNIHGEEKKNLPKARGESLACGIADTINGDSCPKVQRKLRWVFRWYSCPDGVFAGVLLRGFCDNRVGRTLRRMVSTEVHKLIDLTSCF